MSKELCFVVTNANVYTLKYMLTAIKYIYMRKGTDLLPYGNW